MFKTALTSNLVQFHFNFVNVTLIHFAYVFEKIVIS